MMLSKLFILKKQHEAIQKQQGQSYAPLEETDESIHVATSGGSQGHGSLNSATSFKSLDRRKTSSSISQSLPIGRKSQDAAVGVLVQMLKTAQPLRQDSSTYMASMSGVEREGSAVSGTESEFSMARSTSDALEELRNYKQLKDLLLSKSKSVGGATPVH
ncbi:hypothetical protein F2Q70_00040550 [Brassica cretica]|uniref:Autophagy-related protein 13 N-terminal domain-containing protein n=1 Tax=Brassica cretica TaxID=69181 RepID=A0A8S9K0K5_BRACR|nr:hypothetical protein F2Q70_00040550 [Brassica cretica]